MNSKTNEAVKLFSESNKMNLSTAEKIIKIKTKYILLPRKLVYDEEGTFAGYTTPFISKTILTTKENLVNCSLFHLRYYIKMCKL